MDKHVQVIGVLWIVMGALTFLGGLITFGVLFGVSFIPDIEHDAPAILRAVGLGVGMLLTILALPKIIAGIGLLKRKEWGRMLTLIVAFLALINIPLGTALGIYTIIILLKDETVELFKPKS